MRGGHSDGLIPGERVGSPSPITIWRFSARSLAERIARQATISGLESSRSAPVEKSRVLAAGLAIRPFQNAAGADEEGDSVHLVA